MSMIRQCAWCLRLIDDDGERISHSPLPKLYEATHGMCCMCGILWIEQAAKDGGFDAVALWDEMQGFETLARSSCLSVMEVEPIETQRHARRRFVKMLNP
jgi:hypothetical protein